MADWTVPRGDKGYYKPFAITNPDGTAFDLGTYTIKLNMWETGKPDAKLVSGALEIVNASAGTCRYLIGADAFDVPAAVYSAELELSQSTTVKSTISFTIEVTESPL